MSRNGRRLLILTAILILAAFALQAKPNFSGDWKLNIAKSSFGEIPPPISFSEKISHEDPSLKTSVKMSTNNGDWNFDESFSTDGKENVNDYGMGSMKSTLKWEGDSLVVVSKGDFGGGELTINDKWDLSEDGKVLTIARHFSSGMGEVDQKLVLERQ